MSYRTVVALVLSYSLVGVAIAHAQLPQSQPVAVIEITVTADNASRPTSPGHCRRQEPRRRTRMGG